LTGDLIPSPTEPDRRCVLFSGADLDGQINEWAVQFVIDSASLAFYPPGNYFVALVVYHGKAQA
jgi:hypothetical protein